jgi:hypothetical protein
MKQKLSKFCLRYMLHQAHSQIQWHRKDWGSQSTVSLRTVTNHHKSFRTSFIRLYQILFVQSTTYKIDKTREFNDTRTHADGDRSWTRQAINFLKQLLSFSSSGSKSAAPLIPKPVTRHDSEFDWSIEFTSRWHHLRPCRSSVVQGLTSLFHCFLFSYSITRYMFLF